MYELACDVYKEFIENIDNELPDDIREAIKKANQRRTYNWVHGIKED